MNRTLLRIGGAVSLLFAVFNLALVNPIDKALVTVLPDIRATVSTLNFGMAFTLLLFGYLALFCWRELLTTRLGHVTAIGIALFWLLRALSQVIFYGLTTAGVPLIGLCLAFGLLHLIPVVREWNNVASPARRSSESSGDSVTALRDRIASRRWPRYIAVAWCLIFGGLHLYWAMGGTAGFADFSMPSNRVLALTRDPLYLGITWAVVVGCVVGILVALAPFQAWSRRIPRWILLTPLWIACGLFLVRGFGNLIQTALIFAGGMPFEPLSGPETQEWNRWLLVDAMFYSPWFILGGLAFGATAWSVGGQAAGVSPRKRASGVREPGNAGRAKR